MKRLVNKSRVAEKSQIIAVFKTTHETLRAEKWFKQDGISIRTRIKPRSITSECGMALEFPEGAVSQIREICRQKRLKLTGLYREMEKDNWEVLIY